MRRASRRDLVGLSGQATGPGDQLRDSRQAVHRGLPGAAITPDALYIRLAARRAVHRRDEEFVPDAVRLGLVQCGKRRLRLLGERRKVGHDFSREERRALLRDAAGRAGACDAPESGRAHSPHGLIGDLVLLGEANARSKRRLDCCTICQIASAHARCHPRRCGAVAQQPDEIWDALVADSPRHEATAGREHARHSLERRSRDRHLRRLQHRPDAWPREHN